ncbi:MAG: acyl carrier protein [Treponema sp.]|nr:acyl carrier protein [Treponema sp.]
MIEQVVDIISKYTDTPKERIQGETNLLADLFMASVDFIEMICELEDAFGEEIPEGDFKKLVIVENIVNYIKRRTAYHD